MLGRRAKKLFHDAGFHRHYFVIIDGDDLGRTTLFPVLLATRKRSEHAMKTNPPSAPHGTVPGDPALVLLDQARLAELLGCSARTLERQRLEGTGIPFCRVGRLVRYRLLDGNCSPR